MATTRTTVLNRGNYPSGTRSIPERAVADDVRSIGFELARCTTAEPTLWPNVSTTVEVTVEVQYDGVWKPLGSWTAQGGIAEKQDSAKDGGGEWDRSFCIFTLPPGTGRRIRGTANITNGPLRTEVTVLEVTA